MVISRDELLVEIEKYSDCIHQQLKAKKHTHKYGDSYEFINNKFEGRTFTEKCYRYVYGNEVGKCCECGNTPAFVSFFTGYKKYCSRKCMHTSDKRISDIKNTKLERYGDANYNNMEKQRNTCLEKYGVSNVCKLPHIIERAKQTRIERYGSYSWNNYEKNKHTCIERYGVDSFAKTDDFRRYQSDKLLNAEYQSKLRQGIFDKYGTLCPTVGSYKYYNYTLPSGKTIKLQGYEAYTLDELLKVYDECEITSNVSDMPVIFYQYKGKQHRYYPDFYIPTHNLIIETKSDYTYMKELEKNKLKFEAVKNAGYTFELKMYSIEDIKQLKNKL